MLIYPFPCFLGKVPLCRSMSRQNKKPILGVNPRSENTLQLDQRFVPKNDPGVFKIVPPTNRVSQFLDERFVPERRPFEVVANYVGKWCAKTGKADLGIRSRNHCFSLSAPRICNGCSPPDAAESTGCINCRRSGSTGCRLSPYACMSANSRWDFSEKTKFFGWLTTR